MSDGSGPGRFDVSGLHDQEHDLLEALERAKALGFLGPGPVHEHLEQARAYAAAVGAPGAVRVADLGSGGGVPALPLACWWPESRWTLVDRAERRTAFLRDVVVRLGLQDRVEVRTSSAEQAGHDPELRAGFQLVVARSFGAPAVLAECAAALLEVGGRLVVSEPPEQHDDRWPTVSLALLGLSPAVVGEHGGTHVATLTKISLTPDRFPRRRIRGWASA